MVLGDVLVASTECTHALTKRQVNVEADTFFRIGFLKASNKVVFPSSRAEACGFPKGNGRIACIPGAWNIVFFDEGHWEGIQPKDSSINIVT